jgi:hypothetical protein
MELETGRLGPCSVQLYFDESIKKLEGLVGFNLKKNLTSRKRAEEVV